MDKQKTFKNRQSCKQNKAEITKQKGQNQKNKQEICSEIQISMK